MSARGEPSRGTSSEHGGAVGAASGRKWTSSACSFPGLPFDVSCLGGLLWSSTPEASRRGRRRIPRRRPGLFPRAGSGAVRASRANEARATSRRSTAPSHGGDDRRRSATTGDDRRRPATTATTDDGRRRRTTTDDGRPTRRRPTDRRPTRRRPTRRRGGDDRHDDGEAVTARGVGDDFFPEIFLDKKTDILPGAPHAFDVSARQTRRLRHVSACLWDQKIAKLV